MEARDNVLLFLLQYKNQEKPLQLLNCDSVATLKSKAFDLFDIPPHRQEVEGWKHMPESDDTVLGECVEVGKITLLRINDMDIINATNQETGNDNESEDSEIEASISFITKITEKYDSCSVQFHSCKLQDAITDICMAPLEKRRALCLYLHNGNDKFSSIFCENLKKPAFVEILNRSFFFLGYDIEEPQYRSALVKALHDCTALSILVAIVESKAATALCIVPIRDSVTVFCCIKGKVSEKDILTALQNAENFLVVENQQEQKLEELKAETWNENDIGSVNYQKLMADMLGNRDYDRFEYDQHEYLKKKIAFALLGPPQKEEGYEKKDLKKVQALLDHILKNSNEIAKYKDTVEISFIYNCTEPLPNDKISRAKKYEDYNPNTDVMPLPVFVLRKCRGSPNPCRMFVDNIGRTYQTWQEYINRNKLHKCEMILPCNGRYQVDGDGEVLLEKHLSPACGIDSKLLLGADYLSTAGGIVSGGIFIAAAIPAMAVAPAALIAGGVIGIGVGMYSIGRSAYTLYDRKRHKETLNFVNSEARGAYLNILAGSLGFVGVGATMAVSQLAAAGVNIGQGAGAAINTIGIVNMGASGASILNSGYDVFDHWYNENRAPSLLTVVQLGASVLFFGNVAHNFVESTAIDEAQARSLQEYQESLRNNRYRKPFSLLWKKTIRQYMGKETEGKIEVVSPINKIPNKDEVFIVLSRANEDMGNSGVDLSVNAGEIKINDIKIDTNEFLNINKKDASAIVSNFPESNPTSDEFLFIHKIISNTLKQVSLLNIVAFINYVLKLLGPFNNDAKSKIIEVLAALLNILTEPITQTLDHIFQNNSKDFYLLDMIVRFFGKKAELLKEQYKMWIKTNEEQYHDSIFDDVSEDETKRATQFFETAVITFAEHLTEQAEKDLLTCFYNWFAKQIHDYQEKKERKVLKRENSATFPTEAVPCSVCGGYFYRKSGKK